MSRLFIHLWEKHPDCLDPSQIPLLKLLYILIGNMY